MEVLLLYLYIIAFCTSINTGQYLGLIHS